MAAPLKIADIAAECKRLGATVRIWPGAEKIGRPGSLNVHGLTVHITAGGLGSRTAQQYISTVIDMAATTSDPVRANAVAAPDGTLWLTAQGRSNHALYYSARAMQACLDATFPDTGSVDWRGGLTRWSDYTLGIEMIAGSGAKVTTAQRRAALIWCAAVCRLYGWTGGEIHGHGEVSKDRSPLPSGDPGINMGRFRVDAKRIIRQGASTPITTNPGIPSTPQEDDMPDPKDLWEWDGIPAPTPDKTNPNWTPSSYARLTYANARAARIAAEQSLALQKAAAKGAGITDAQIAQIVDGVADKLGDGFDLTLTPKEA